MQQSLPEPRTKPAPVPRRQALRSLIGLVTGVAALAGLAAGGGDGDDDEDD